MKNPSSVVECSELIAGNIEDSGFIVSSSLLSIQVLLHRRAPGWLLYSIYNIDIYIHAINMIWWQIANKYCVTVHLFPILFHCNVFH